MKANLVAECVGDIEDAVRDAVNDELSDHVEIENDGIGSYEFHGQRCNDRGNDFAVLNEFSLALDVTGTKYLDWEDSISGSGSYDDFQVDWNASFKRKVEENGKVWLLFTVEQKES